MTKNTQMIVINDWSYVTHARLVYDNKHADTLKHTYTPRPLLPQPCQACLLKEAMAG